MSIVQFDLHGCYPDDMYHGLLDKIIEQAWQMGADSLVLIHGHGRQRGRSIGFANSNTGKLGLAVRRTLRESLPLRQWIYHSTLDRSYAGLTSVRLKPNPSPTRTEFKIC